MKVAEEEIKRKRTTMSTHGFFLESRTKKKIQMKCARQICRPFQSKHSKRSHLKKMDIRTAYEFQRLFQELRAEIDQLEHYRSTVPFAVLMEYSRLMCITIEDLVTLEEDFQTMGRKIEAISRRAASTFLAITATVTATESATATSSTTTTKSQRKCNICSICKVEYRRSVVLKRHMLEVHGEKPQKTDDGRFECNICNRKFTRKFYAKRHIEKCSQ